MMSSKDSKHSSDLKIEDVEKSSSIDRDITASASEIEATFDPIFVKRTMCASNKLPNYTCN